MLGPRNLAYAWGGHSLSVELLVIAKCLWQQRRELLGGEERPFLPSAFPTLALKVLKCQSQPLPPTMHFYTPVHNAGGGGGKGGRTQPEMCRQESKSAALSACWGCLNKCYRLGGGGGVGASTTEIYVTEAKSPRSRCDEG